MVAGIRNSIHFDGMLIKSNEAIISEVVCPRVKAVTRMSIFFHCFI
jgi:hypothetical protein